MFNESMNRTQQHNLKQLVLIAFVHNNISIEATIYYDVKQFKFMF